MVDDSEIAAKRSLFPSGTPYRPPVPPRDPTALQGLVARGMTMLAGHSPGVAAGITADMTGMGGLRDRTLGRVAALRASGLTPEAVTKFRTDQMADVRGTFHLPDQGALPPGLTGRPVRTPEQIAAYRTARTTARTAARKTYTDAMTAYRASLNKPPTP